MCQFWRFFRYHSRADALTSVIDLALYSCRLFQICAILFDVNSGCPGTGWQSFSLYLDLLSLIDGFFSKMRPSVSISFLAFHTKVGGLYKKDFGCSTWKWSMSVANFQKKPKVCVYILSSGLTHGVSMCKFHISSP